MAPLTLGALVHGASARQTSSAASVRRARRVRHCASRSATTCAYAIPAGDLYVRSVAFPGHDAVSDTRPWVLTLCEPCTRWHAGFGDSSLASLFAAPTDEIGADRD